MNAENIGKKILSLRKAKGMTQKELADLLYVSEQAVSKWERGKNFPDLALMERLAESLGTTVNELLALESHATTEDAKEITHYFQQKDMRRKNILWLTGFFLCVIGIFVLSVLLWRDFYYYHDVHVMRCAIYGTELIFFARLFWCVLIAGLVIGLLFMIFSKWKTNKPLKKGRKKFGCISAIVYGICFVATTLCFVGAYAENQDERRWKEVSEEEYAKAIERTGMMDMSDFSKYSATGTVERERGILGKLQIKEKSDYYIPTSIQYEAVFTLDSEQGTQTTIICHVEYYEARDEQTAKMLARQIVPGARKCEPLFNYGSPGSEFDDIVLNADYYEFFVYGDAPVVIMQEGNRVVSVWFVGNLLGDASKEIDSLYEWIEMCEDHFLSADQ